MNYQGSGLCSQHLGFKEATPPSPPLNVKKGHQLLDRDKMPFRCYQHTPAMEAAWQGLVPEDLERRLHKFTMDLEAETVRLTRKTEDCGRGPTPTPSEVRGGGGAFPASPQGAPFCRGLVYGERDTVRTAERWTRTSVKWAVPFKHPSFSELRGSDCGLVQVVCPPPRSVGM